MAVELSRRAFVRTTIVTGAGLAVAGSAWRPGTARAAEAAAVSGEKPLYVFPFLGDIHYDKIEYHDMDWMKQHMPGDIHQVQGYSKVTADFTPGLYKEVAETVRAAKAGGVDVPFVIQVGDLVEGCCGKGELHEQMCHEATAAVEQSDWGVPCLMTKGNHDITGPGAAEVFDKVLLPWMGKQAGTELQTASYVTRHGDDVFVFFDGYKPDVAWLETALEKNRGKRVFFITHMPVVPYDARADWIVYSRDEQRAERAKLLSLMGKYGVIVLSGHLHKYSVLSRKTDAGSFVQLAVCSVIRHAQEKPNHALEGLEAYNADLVKLEPNFSPKSLDARRAILEGEKPFIERYEYADLPGYSMVRVYGDRVEVDVYAGLEPGVWRVRKLV